MKVKHTPGPWKVNTAYDVRTIYPKSQGYGVTIARIHNHFVEPEANAKLIAAAPELLAALKECAKQLRLLDCNGHAAIAENAISKATE